jgi:hypothetical protein
VKTMKLLFFTSTGGAVVGIYAVAPFTASLRPVLGGLLLPVVLAIAIVSTCATKIVTILRRTAPFAEASSDLLSMPVLMLEEFARQGLSESAPLAVAWPAQAETVTGQESAGHWALAAYAQASQESVLFRRPGGRHRGVPAGWPCASPDDSRGSVVG